MSFHITRVDLSSFPDAGTVERAGQVLGAPIEELSAIVRGFASETPPRPGIGHQQVLAAELERHVQNSLATMGLQRVSTSVSPVLGERVDFAAGLTAEPPYLLGEIEFRPNFEKDLVKFAIASRRGLLGLGVLIVAKTRNEINPGYTSMPQYDKVIRTVAELAPQFPLAVLGVSGKILGALANDH